MCSFCVQVHTQKKQQKNYTCPYAYYIRLSNLREWNILLTRLLYYKTCMHFTLKPTKSSTKAFSLALF